MDRGDPRKERSTCTTLYSVANVLQVQRYIRLQTDTTQVESWLAKQFATGSAVPRSSTRGATRADQEAGHEER